VLSRDIKITQKDRRRKTPSFRVDFGNIAGGENALLSISFIRSFWPCLFAESYFRKGGIAALCGVSCSL